MPAFGQQALLVRSHTLVSEVKDIYLSDIVDKNSTDNELFKEISSVKLANGPRLGERRVLSSQLISRLLRKQAHFVQASKKMKLVIPSQVIVENIGYTLNERDVENRLNEVWAKSCIHCRFQISSLSLPKMKSQAQKLNWDLDYDGKIPRGQFSYKVTVKNQEGQDITGWIQGMVRIFAPVPIATRAIHFGERLTEHDLEVKEQDVTYSNDSAIERERAIGRRVIRAIRSGEVLWSNFFEKDYATRRGQPVKLIIGDQGWQLTLQGIAEMDGQIGDTISVKNSKSNKVLSGVVIGQHEVQVQ
ncbi:MAG: flagellar basal body P-ring formation protein FlgA [Bdellovibrionales bacterium]|nr:flagellar basal body P-ring formation protein FlgA [Bdellovibrionales bacterium]